MIQMMNLKIELEFDKELYPYFPEALIRGSLGYSLKKLVCIKSHSSNCSECLLCNSCVYSIMFNNENLCDNSTMEKFWPHGGAVHHYGTWKRTQELVTGKYIIITLFGEKETIYYYEFRNNYQTMGLKIKDTDNFIYYSKQ